MILYIGTEEKGYFVEEFAYKEDLTFKRIEEALYIEQQVNDIIEQANVTHMVFELAQYIDKPSTLADRIEKLKLSTNAQVILVGDNESVDSDIIQAFLQKGFKSIILEKNLSRQKELFEAAYRGENTIKHLVPDDEVAPGDKRPSKGKTSVGVEHIQDKSGAKLIGVAGACNRIGTTTMCMQFVKALFLAGKSACYVNMNDTTYIDDYLDNYEYQEHDEELGKLTAENIDHYYKIEKLSEIKKAGYDYLIYDYGNYKDNYFNKTSFLEKDKRIFVAGSKPGEFSATKKLIQNMFYDDCYYIFNFTPENEKEELLELMDDKSEFTFFAPTANDKYALAATDIYNMILELPIAGKNKAADRKSKKRKRGFGLFQKKERAYE